jgi:EF-hand domain-containing family member B
LNEKIYKSKSKAPLGRTPLNTNLPNTIEPNEYTFSVESKKGERAKECINPNKSANAVEQESSCMHEMYVKSHNDYEPGEQKDRSYFRSFDRTKKFGLTKNVHYDGRLVKKSLEWVNSNDLNEMQLTSSKILNDFREKHYHQLGQSLDP